MAPPAIYTTRGAPDGGPPIIGGGVADTEDPRIRWAATPQKLSNGMWRVYWRRLARPTTARRIMAPVEVASCIQRFAQGESIKEIAASENVFPASLTNYILEEARIAFRKLIEEPAEGGD